jgi:hypothetical protein
MQPRLRSPRERRLNFSLSEPHSLRPQKHKLPLLLPTLTSHKPRFYDEIQLSPDFVNIPITTPSRNSTLPPSDASLSNSRAHSHFLSQRYNRHIVQQYAEEDRIVQRYDEQQEKYKQLVKRIKEKSAARARREERSGLSLIYERFMGLL